MFFYCLCVLRRFIHICAPRPLGNAFMTILVKEEERKEICGWKMGWLCGPMGMDTTLMIVAIFICIHSCLFWATKCAIISMSIYGLVGK
jgi:hypothetical protein